MTTTALVDLAGTAASWVLYLLIALSAIQLAVILERAVVYFRTRAPRSLRANVRRAVADGPKAVTLAVAGGASLEAKAVAAAVAAADRDPETARELVRGAMVDERLRLERALAFLGTLGNNAPFLGLFGTVLGVIHATRDLSTAAGRAGAQVMAGISEALVSTAVGLLVALPAVIAFNYFQRILKTRSLAAEALAGEVTAQLAAPASASRKAA